MRVLAVVEKIRLSPDEEVPVEPGNLLKIDLPPAYATLGQEVYVTLLVRVQAKLGA